MGGKGSGGRNRKPTAVKKLHGNPGHRKLNQKEPAAAPGEPRMPKYLSPRARGIWKELVPQLLKMGTLKTCDGLALAALCTAAAQVEKADAAIERYGIICATLDQITGVAELKVNPAVRIKSDALRHLRSSLSQFGLDPASRSAIKTDDQPHNPLEDFLSGDTAGEVVQ